MDAITPEREELDPKDDKDNPLAGDGCLLKGEGPEVAEPPRKLSVDPTPENGAEKEGTGTVLWLNSPPGLTPSPEGLGEL